MTTAKPVRLTAADHAALNYSRFSKTAHIITAIAFYRQSEVERLAQDPDVEYRSWVPGITHESWAYIAPNVLPWNEGMPSWLVYRLRYGTPVSYQRRVPKPTNQ